MLKRLDSQLAEVGRMNFPGRPASSDKSWFQGALRVKVVFANLVLPQQVSGPEHKTRGKTWKSPRKKRKYKNLVDIGRKSQFAQTNPQG